MLQAAIVALLLLAAPVRAEIWEVQVYSGVQIARDSRVRVSDPAMTGSFSFMASWDGRSLAVPPYYGLRATRWLTLTDGVAVEFNHAKVSADSATLARSGYTRLEFTDGLNLLTVNWMRRLRESGGWTPYGGLGVGLAIPHVDVETGASRTSGYQLTGPAATAIAGVSRRIGNDWSVFGEYKLSFSANRVDLDGGGRLKADIVTHAVNLGVGYRF